MKFLKKHKREASEGLPDVVDLVSLGIATHETRRAAPLATEDGAPPQPEILKPTDEHRARAQSLLYDFAMRHFSSQVEALRQGAIIEYLANSGRNRMRFARLFSIGVCATLTAIGLAAASSIAAARYGIDSERVTNMFLELLLIVRTRLGI